MLRFHESFVGSQVTSLQSGRVIAQVIDLLIDPDNLDIPALICFSQAKDDSLFLVPSDIHHISDRSISVQTDEVLSTLDDLVKLQEIMNINFKLVGKKVKTDAKRKVGVVTEYIVDDEAMKIMKIHARPPVTKMLNNSDLVISRSQIIEVTDTEIVVRDTFESTKQLARAAAK